MKNSFLIYYEYQEILEDLTNEEVGILLRSIFDYEIKKVEPNFTGLLKMAFRVIKGNLDRDKDKYDKRCISSKENGKLGGRPKREEEKPKNNLNKPKNNLGISEKPKKPDNDNDNDIDNDTDNDIDNDTDTEKSADLLVEEEVEKSADLFSLIESGFGRTLNGIEYEKINSWENNELNQYAVKESILNGARSIRYIETVIESWKAKGFKTIEDVKKYQNKFNQDKNKKFNQQNEIVPDWFNQNIDCNKPTLNEKEQMEKLLKEIGEE